MGNPRLNKWFIAIKKKEDDIFDLSNLTILEPPKDHYWADPFLHGDLLFYELYDYEKGVIAYSKIQKDLSLSEPKVVLDLSYHCSFPSLFEEDGEVYMTPETVLSGQLKIFKASKFPDEWEVHTVVASGRYDDPILYKRNGNYYILATEDGDKLVTFVSKHLNGDWRITRVEIPCSRGAGRPFEYKGKFLRPTQDWIPQYGKAIVIKDVETNAVIKRIEADWYPDLIGTHTFNFNDKYVVIDGKIKL